MKIWTCGSSPWSRSEMSERGSKRQQCQSSEQLLECFRRDPNDFLLRLMTMDETWLYHYNPETKQQLIEWRHSGSPRPTKFRVQKSAGKFSPRFFGIKTASSSLIIFQRAKLTTRSITHLCWCNWGTFWRKNAAGSSPIGSCSCTTMPRLTGHVQRRRKWLTWVYSVLSISGSGPVGLPPGLWTEKNNWMFAIFRSMRRSLLPRKPGWTDNILNFFLSGLQKLELRAKKCIELRGENVE